MLLRQIGNKLMKHLRVHAVNITAESYSVFDSMKKTELGQSSSSQHASPPSTETPSTCPQSPCPKLMNGSDAMIWTLAGNVIV